MPNKDVVFEKVKQVQRCLKRIHDKTHDNSEQLDNIDVQDIFVLNLQRAVQTTIDLASHVIAEEGYGIPSDLKENFIILEKNKIIPAELSNQLQKMVGFRNIAVHDYSAIEVAILKSVLNKNLKDLEDFYTAILQHFKWAWKNTSWK